jgi:uncharacterized membrane protein YozB (DUF420 family)
MSVHSHDPMVPGKGIKDIGQLGTWLALISFTFLFATFIASNVYLRGWSPESFALNLSAEIKNIVYLNFIFTILSGILAIATGISYKKKKNSLFLAFYILMGGAFLGDLFLTGWMVTHYYHLGATAWTAYGMVEILMLLLDLVCVILFLTGFFYMKKNKAKSLNRFIPGALTVWVYTMIMGIIVFIQCDVMQIEQFLEWCGIKAAS